MHIFPDQPHNPMVNAGAIVIGSLLKQELSLPERFDYVGSIRPFYFLVHPSGICKIERMLGASAEQSSCEPAHDT